MRQVASLTTESEARRFADYLLSIGIRTQVDPEDNTWIVWVIDEDKVARGREELTAFQSDPAHPRYAAAQAEVRRNQAAAARPASRVVDLRERWATPRGVQPLVIVLLALCVLISAFTSFGSEQKEFQSRLKIAPTVPANALPGPFPAANHLAEVRQGEVWRLVTPVFLHFGLLHVLFNLMWLQSLGNAIEFRKGTWAMTGLVLFIAVISNVAEYEAGVLLRQPYPGNFGGMSGVNYGLFGYLWAKGRFDPASGLGVSSQTVMIMMLWLFLCMTGMVGPIANTAHATGLLAGGLAALVPLLFRHRP